MLGLAEYIVLSKELHRLGQQLETEIAARIEGLGKRDAQKVAKEYVPQYMQRYRTLLRGGLFEIATNAIEYHDSALDTGVDRVALANAIVDRQFQEKYYGASLESRLRLSEIALNRRIIRSAQVGPEHVAGVFTKAFPFGAQISIDKRLMLSTSAKIENDVARVLAEKADIPFIRWTLSHRHKVKDDCDTLAEHVNRDIVMYLEEHNLKLDPKGLYFRDKLPLPPHPNCQCEYVLVSHRGRIQTGPVNRALRAVRKLIKRLRGK